MSTTLTATIPLSVAEDPVQYRIVVATPPTKTSYDEGDKLATAGIVVNLEKYTAKKGVIQTTNVTSSCTFSPANNTTLSSSNTAITITYTSTATGTLTTQQAITVSSLAQRIMNGTETPALRTTLSTKMSDGTTLTWEVVNVADNGDVTFGLAGYLSNKMKMFETDPGVSKSYKYTDLRAYLTGTFFNMFPDEIKAAIKGVQRTYFTTTTKQENNTTKYVINDGSIETVTDTVWIPSYAEIWGTYTHVADDPRNYLGETQHQYVRTRYMGWCCNHMNMRSNQNLYQVGTTAGTYMQNVVTSTTEWQVRPFFVIGRK